MTYTRLFAGAAVAALTLAGAGSAAAQTYDRLVVFGDSLSDSGNLYAATAGARPLSPPYFQGRFSNGPVFTELLGFTPLQLGVTGATTGNVNNAFGGARTDMASSPPSLRLQVLGYLARGGTFGANDLVSIYGGGNNLIEGVLPAAVSPNPAAAMQATAIASAADIGFLVNQVAGAGAGTILVSNLPNLGTAPAFNTGPAAPLAGLGSSTFNTALAGQVQAAAAANPGTNVILVDVGRFGDAVRANPGAFGFSDITTACLNTTTGTVCSSPDTYQFWDGVHPTARANQYLAALATDYLYYGDFGRPYAHVAEQGLDHRQQSLERAFDRIEDGELAAGASTVTLLLDGQEATFDAEGASPEGDIQSTSARIAADYGFSDTLRGGAMISISHADAQAGPLSFTARSFGADAYAGWRGPSLFVNAGVGFSADEYDDFERVTPVGGLVNRAGRTDGFSVGARVQTGVWLDMGGLRLSPRATANLLRTSVDGHQEDGAGARQRHEDRTVGGLAGELALRAETNLSQGLSVHGEIGYRDWLAGDFDDLRVSLVDNPAQMLSVESEGEGGLLLDLGVSSPLAGRFTVGATYRARVGDTSDSHAGLISVSMRY